MCITVWTSLVSFQINQVDPDSVYLTWLRSKFDEFVLSLYPTLTEEALTEVVVDTLMECLKDGNAGKFHSSAYHKFIHTLFDHKKAKWDAEVAGDGIYIPATDDEVMKAEDLIDHKSSLHYVLDNSQTAVCNSNDDTFGQEFMPIDCEADVVLLEPPVMEGLDLLLMILLFFNTPKERLLTPSMMKCFSIFHSKPTGERSSPEAKDNNPPRKLKSEARLVIKSTVSISSPARTHESYREKENKLKKFSFSELRDATTNFNKLLKIGEGGFGRVYKARIRLCESQKDPLVVAIKKLNRESMQGHKEWQTELQFLGVVDHPNLVKLLGYCSVDGERMQRLLVYEYMPNKSLEVHLFNMNLPPIPWKTRLRILLGAAEGLDYLHRGLEIQVIFRDFKSSNVLLDENFNPKLSDFGLAREGPQGDKTHVSTKPVGTYGYVAPEYTETGHLRSKSDVWSFGVVVFEILTGRRAVDRSLPKAQQKLTERVKEFPPYSRNFWMVIDKRLNNQYSLDAARSIAKMGLSCLCKNPDDRPTMNQVVEGLRDAIGKSE
ncbi:hypothetical protein L1987_17461 [Smallanthus sonchifolius]|uniref:Uncharacterized protein n=1 Tax=Smallanthus sonchifolius TaxID=185202 RepID=A0ACB9IXV0_9ASTR|nr:hypothetical protein L1987_17461 [Smallanthus sonchifolius]